MRTRYTWYSIIVVRCTNNAEQQFLLRTLSEKKKKNRKKKIGKQCHRVLTISVKYVRFDRPKYFLPVLIVNFTHVYFHWFAVVIIEEIKDLLAAMEKDWTEVIREEDRNKMMKFAKFSRILSTKVNAFCYSLIVVYAATRCLSMRTEGRLSFFPSYFPFESMTSPLFELKFVGQMIGAIYYSITYTAVDTFLAMLILHVCGQLSRLQNDLIDLNSATSEDFRTKINYIVERHNHLNR